MTPLRLMLLMAALALLAVVVQFGLVSVAFEKLGLSQASAYLLMTTTLVGSLLNLPLFSLPAAPGDIVEEPPEIFRLPGLPRPRFAGRIVVAVNVGGAVTPAAFSLYLLLNTPLSLTQVAAEVAFVALVAYWVSVPIRGVGIGMHALTPPLAAASSSLIINPESAAPLAYIGGSLGVLVGADLMRLPAIRRIGAPIVSIGGAGSFDGIFLSGLLAVLLA